MNVLYMANVGTRDVIRDGKYASTVVDGRPAPSCRADGEVWLQDYDSFRPVLAAPILQPGLQSVLELAAEVVVVLFYSNQDETTPEKYRRGDTIFFAQILRRLLPHLFPHRVRAEVHQLPGNPSDYNNAVPFFTERLPQLAPAAGVDAVYVAPVGGADASNVGLTIGAVRCYRDKCQFIYVSDSRVDRLNLHEELLADPTREAAQAHRARHDYIALADTLRRYPAAREWHRYLCEYADRRARFDFHRADAALENALRTAESGETRLLLQNMQASLKPFLEPVVSATSSSPLEQWDRSYAQQQRLLGELFFNLHLKARQGEWVDFLGRLFRLQEAVLRLAFEMETRHSTDKQKKEFPDFVKAVAERPELRAYLESAEIRFEDPNMISLKCIVDFWVKCGGKGREYGKIKRFVDTCGGDELANLRNKSIVAHGYKGISAEDITKAAGMSVDELLDQLKGALDCLRVSTDDSRDPLMAVQKAFNRILQPTTP
jgi:hypothetical protein